MDNESSKHDSLEVILQDQSAEPCDLRLQYLRGITDNFSGERELGRGGSGVVYKGVLPNGVMIAVKSLIWMTEFQEKQFKNEVDILMRVRHQNIVRFVGYCYETWMKYIEYDGKHIFAEMPQMLLCFEYMPNGSLYKYISVESCGLDWQKRYKIIKGICCGLHYLHQECQINASIIHLDLKPANILLDENMLPKIADFGLSKFFDDQKTRTRATTPGGSLGYMAPEYLFEGMITNKVDIYSLGVIIIEVIAGHKISPYNTGTSYSDFVKLVLKNWRNRLEAAPSYTSLEIDYQQIEVCLAIGLSCINSDPSKRPATRQIIERLNRWESSQLCASNEELPPADPNANGECEDGTIKSIVSDPIVDTSQSPSRWPLEFKKKQQDIIELWHACDVSLLHRTYFFLLFKGDQADSIYMEVELRRLAFLRDSQPLGRSTPSNVKAGSSNSSPDVSAKKLRREREMLARQMQKRLTSEERKRMYNKWGVPLDSENRKLQVARRLWTETRDLEHVRASASLIAKLMGLNEDGQALRKMLQTGSVSN